jgi:transcriptional regulator with XRE-family HTH domain
MLFKERLRTLREKMGMTQESLARSAVMPVGNIRNYEQGIRLPSFPMVVRLASALGTDCRAFADCEDISPTPAESAETPVKSHRKSPKKVK